MILKSKSFNQAEKRKAYFFYILLIFIAAVFVALPRLSIPILIAHIIYLIISPTIPMLQKVGLSRSKANLIVFALFIFTTVYPFILIFPIITEEAQNIQFYLPKLDNYLREQSLVVQAELKERVGYTLEDDYLPEMIDLARTKLTTFLLTLPNYIGNLLEWVFLIPLIIFFLLKDGGRFKKNILSLAPNNVFERFYFLTHKFNKKLGDYIFAKFIEGLLVGIIIWIGLLFIGIRFSLILALIAALTNIIPYVGPILGFVPALIFALAEFGADGTTMAIVILYMVANAIDIALVFPILVSKVVDLHPMLVVISVIIGGQWLGIIGMVISIPLAAALKLIFEEVYKEFYERA